MTTFENATEEYRKGRQMGIENPIRFVDTDEETYYYALGTVPPAAYGRDSFLMGEPYSHTAQGDPICYAFVHYPTTGYKCALMTLSQFKESFGG